MATCNRDTLKARWRRFVDNNRQDAINRYDDWQSRWRDIYLGLAARSHDKRETTENADQ